MLPEAKPPLMMLMTFVPASVSVVAKTGAVVVLDTRANSFVQPLTLPSVSVETVICCTEPYSVKLRRPLSLMVIGPAPVRFAGVSARRPPVMVVAPA